MEQGLAHRIERLNAYVACAHPGPVNDPAFMICRSCHKVAEAEAAPHTSPSGAGRVPHRTDGAGGAGALPCLPDRTRSMTLIAAAGVDKAFDGQTVLHGVSPDCCGRGDRDAGRPQRIGQIHAAAAACGGVAADRRPGHPRARACASAMCRRSCRLIRPCPSPCAGSCPCRNAPGMTRRAPRYSGLGLPDLFGRQMSDLSGGQFQRVLLARALLAEPNC